MTGKHQIVQELLSRAGAAEFIGPALWTDIRREFPGQRLELWGDSLQQLLDAGAPSSLILSYARISPAVARRIGADAALELGSTSLLLLDKAGAQAAGAMVSHAVRAADLLKQREGFELWLAALRELAAVEPSGVEPVCARTDTLLARLDARAFRAWLLAGLMANDDSEHRQAYLSLADTNSLRVLDQEASGVRLSYLERRLQAYVAGLWRLTPVIRPAAIKKAMQVPRRASFDGHLVRMPETFAGYSDGDAQALFKAAIAHIGAHMVFTLEKFPVKTLKPIQVALVSIIEDARVELLAGKQYPGLLRLWRSFHVAEPSGPNLAGPLMARLARALIDPRYQDDNPWIVKGRQMFAAAGPDWSDPQEIRRIGVLLGNDLGQMRVQFNPKTYVVQPPYRDDNVGIWDFGSPSAETADDPDLIYESVRIEQTENLEDPHQRERDQAERDEAQQAGRVRLVEQDSGVPVARHPEWNYHLGRLRPDWATIMEYQPRESPSEIIAQVLARHAEVERRIAALVKQARVGRPVRVRRRPEGDRLDLEACIRVTIDRRAGHLAEARVYESTALLERDLSVLVLIDISESTKDTVKGTAVSVFSIERAATALLAEAMAGVGDPFAIHAFNSDGRNDVRYYRVKDFGQPYGALAKSRLAGLQPGYSTRMGAALRQAGSEIAGQLSHRRLVLVITDGEPSDVDAADDKYLVEDARKAVHELGHAGIDVFCVALDSSGDSYLGRIFGRRNVVQIDRLASLPEKLPMLYFRLTA